MTPVTRAFCLFIALYFCDADARDEQQLPAIILRLGSGRPHLLFADRLLVHKESAIKANMKAFIVNRVGDFGFILGIGLLFAFAGSLHYGEVFKMRTELAGFTLPGSNWGLLTVTCLCLFIGAMGKSAQFPLHVWLPDSMEGPTPISALIHAATMVTAGIFMVTRMSPLFELSESTLS